MITRYNTNRDATREIIFGSLFMALILAIAPPALEYTATASPTTTAVLVTYLFFWGCGLLLLLFCVYRYYHWSEHDDAYLLSSRTLAIVSPGKPVRYIKPRDIVALRRDGMRLIQADGTHLRLPHLPVKQGVSALPHAIIITWYGEEFLDNANKAYTKFLYPTTTEITTGIALVALALVVTLGLAFAGMWREFARFSYGAFIAGSVLGGIFILHRAYYVRNLVFPLTAPTPSRPDTESFNAPRRSSYPGSRIEVQRLPAEQPKAIESAGMSLLVLFTLSIFIPLCRLALSYDTLEQSTRMLILLIAFDLTLIAVYCVGRLYQTIIRGDIFVTVLLSSRTIAILRPRKPVDYIKPAECAALVCGRNELVLHDGRILALAKDLQLDEERTVCKTLCQQWWPDAYGKEPEGLWANISTPCKRQTVIGILIALIGFAILIPWPGPWGTAIAHHFIVPGAIYALYGILRGLRGHGRVIDLTAPAGE